MPYILNFIYLRLNPGKISRVIRRGKKYPGHGSAQDYDLATTAAHSQNE
jgi:hypothetical protein